MRGLIRQLNRTAASYPAPVPGCTAPATSEPRSPPLPRPQCRAPPARSAYARADTLPCCHAAHARAGSTLRASCDQSLRSHSLSRSCHQRHRRINPNTRHFRAALPHSGHDYHPQRSLGLLATGPLEWPLADAPALRDLRVKSGHPAVDVAAAARTLSGLPVTGWRAQRQMRSSMHPRAPRGRQYSLLIFTRLLFAGCSSSQRSSPRWLQV
ncbi:hypothetical protein FA95DRAFT_904566 [Auriscalpium vulgare]|uniref:Uncharacterized protein n=1 Tax=Auriscalpium vulgare TaxID=40419 RepID=A0ACB8R7Z6_9AGAM|nr:hypothetical protein FA95DRAFT_904566 [Auriscalpium vulgare]